MKLSEQLASLSARAKTAEDSLAAAEKEAHEQLAKHQQKARDDAKLAVEKVDQELKKASDTAEKSWGALRAKIAADLNALKADIAHHKHEHDVKRAKDRADRLEWEAGFAIDYAIASIEQAKLAVLDAIDGRVAADEAAQS
ncbi:MAG: hypothetical protein JOY90_09890 [Bradyrhizobium sp.]|uniref:hypothetical protein n=1 Tax=Bradyrhizobium sp. TaxID=376 RepID=UPI001DD83EC1|nr:hypothetical protein [Bradyrhizobium sp.]MBV9560751.1 hypothetical protein [Bradyrhizobium sp.]